MKKIKFVFSLFAFLLLTMALPSKSLAQSISLTGLDEEDVEGVVQDITSLMMHTTVSPASPVSNIFGLEFGLIANYATVPTIKSISGSQGGDIKSLPSAMLMLAMSVEPGITLELNWFPNISFAGAAVGLSSVGAKWTFTRVLLPDFPFDVAIRPSYSDAKLSFDQKEGGTTYRTEINNNVTGVSMIFSRDWIIFEPFLNVTYLMVRGKLSSTSDMALDSGVTGDSNPSTVSYFIGGQFKLLGTRIAAELGRVFESTKASVKISWAF